MAMMSSLSRETTTALLELQEKVDALFQEKANGGTTASSIRYERLFAPLLERRKEIVMEIPQFWLRTLVNHPTMGALITADDCKRLQALLDVDVVQMSQCSTADFKVVFTFGPNEYFQNECLSKCFQYKELDGLCIASEEIQWREGMDPSTMPLDADDDYGMYRKSFFEWFGHQTDHLHIGELIRDEIHPSAINLFLGSFVTTNEVFDDSDDDTETIGDPDDNP